MNERIYKSSIFKVIKEIISLCLGCVFLIFVLHFFVSDRVNLGIVVCVFLFFLVMTMRDRKLYVKVTDDKIVIVKGKKVNEYNLKECSLRISSNNNDIFTLYVTDLNGDTKSFDLSFLGFRKFNEFIEDVGIVGEKAETISLKAD